MDLSRVNALAGKQLKAWREKLGLSTRAVQTMSRQIATQHQNEEFFLSHNWVTDIENGRFRPGMFRMASDKTPSLAEVSDESLLSRIGVGDREALAALFERYARLTRSVAARILRDTTEAEDLVQDLFLYIQRKCGIFDSSKSTARSWIVQMAYHRALDRRRYLQSREFYAQPTFQRMASKWSENRPRKAIIPQKLFLGVMVSIKS